MRNQDLKLLQECVNNYDEETIAHDNAQEILQEAKNELVYDLLELREKIYTLSSNDDIDDTLLEMTNSIALELGVDVEKIINWNRKAGI